MNVELEVAVKMADAVFGKLSGEQTVETSKGRMTPSQIVSDLTYACYAHNRRTFPHVTPEQWVPVFGSHAAAMEEAFQHNLREERLAGEDSPTPQSPSQPKGSVITDEDLQRDAARLSGMEAASGCYDE